MLIKICIRIHVNIVLPLAFVTSFLMDEALLSISPAGLGQLVNIPLTLEAHGIFGHILTLSRHLYAKR